jgi:dolichol-phosphate mannosyltransferase
MTASQSEASGSGPVWVVLPTFNEALNLHEAVARIQAAAPDATVLVVDDESPDGTGGLADALAKQDPRVVVLHRRGERGLGRALAAGLQRAVASGASVALAMDCDLSHDPGDIPRFVLAAQSADLVLGSRYIPGGHMPNWAFHRKLLSAAANVFVRILFMLPARDCTTGYRAYRSDVLGKIPFDRLNSAGYSFQVEILFWITRLGSRGVREIPITFVDRAKGTSKMGPREAIAGALNLLRVRLALLR